jgi:signal transduction histidine kinase/CheY-like chemotaxis protein
MKIAKRIPSHIRRPLSNLKASDSSRKRNNQSFRKPWQEHVAGHYRFGGRLPLSFRKNTSRAFPVGFKRRGELNTSVGFLNRQTLPEHEEHFLQEIHRTHVLLQNAKADLYALKEEMALLKKQYALKERYFCTMAHEVRTPMNGILGIMDLLLQTELSSEQIDYLKAVKSSGDALLNLINDALDLSKLEAGKMTLQSIPFETGQLLKTIHRIFESKAAEKNIRLEVKTDPALTQSLLGDPYKISQILLNLTSNAIKFTSTGTILIEARQTEKRQGKIGLDLIVSDTGKGIADNKMKYLFQEFSQISTTSMGSVPGSGLGLNITKRIIRLMGGKIQVSSTIGYGTQFKVSLRLKIVPTTPLKASDTTSNPAQVPPLALDGIRILMAEDNPINQILGKKILSRVGAYVEIASNGKEALEKLKSNKYDLILMDIRMPEMDGYETSRQIRLSETVANNMTPIIALTANQDPEEKNNCFLSGMNAYLKKPYTSSELIQVLISLLPPILQQREGITENQTSKPPIHDTHQPGLSENFGEG